MPERICFLSSFLLRKDSAQYELRSLLVNANTGRTY